MIEFCEEYSSNCKDAIKMRNAIEGKNTFFRCAGKQEHKLVRGTNSPREPGKGQVGVSGLRKGPADSIVKGAGDKSASQPTEAIHT